MTPRKNMSVVCVAESVVNFHLIHCMGVLVVWLHLAHFVGELKNKTCGAKDRVRFCCVQKGPTGSFCNV